VSTSEKVARDRPRTAYSEIQTHNNRDNGAFPSEDVYHIGYIFIFIRLIKSTAKGEEKQTNIQN